MPTRSLPSLLSLCLVLLAVSLLTSAHGLSTANAQASYSKYVWEKPWITPNPTPSTLEQEVRQELQAQIQQVIDFCCTGRTTPRHLGPFYVAQGYIAEDFFWLDPGETVLVLSEALDFVSESQRSELIRYLKYEMQTTTYSPLTFSVQGSQPSPLLEPANFRSFYQQLPAELARGYLKVDVGPRPQDLYAAWAFAHYVSRYENPNDSSKAWDIINSQWSAISQIFNTIPATPQTYWQIMGAIGYARMAQKLGYSYTTAEQRAINGLSAGVNYVQFYRNMATAEFCQGNQGTNGWVGVWDYCGFTAVNPVDMYQGRFNHNGYAGQSLENKPSMFAVDIGRFLKDNAQTAVVNHINRYLNPTGAAYFPFWWENKGLKPWAVRDENTPLDGNGENAIMHPSFAWQMFMLRATVFPNITAAQMQGYVDTPWAIGDIFHLQKLITVLRLYGSVQWSESDQISSRKTASPVAADLGETINFTITVLGSGKSTTVTDVLPAQLGYLSHSTTCPLGAINYNSGARQVTYSGTVPASSNCTINIATEVNTSDRLALVNSATINDGLLSYAVSVMVLLNGLPAYLPIIRKG